MNSLSKLNTAVLFTNWTSEDFIGRWAGEDYRFPAKTSEWISVGTHDHNLGLAKHFAKHLTDRELNKRNVPTDHFSREEFEKNCFIELAEATSIPVQQVEIHQDTGLVKAVKEIGREDVKTGKIVAEEKEAVVDEANLKEIEAIEKARKEAEEEAKEKEKAEKAAAKAKEKADKEAAKKEAEEAKKEEPKTDKKDDKFEE